MTTSVGASVKPQDAQTALRTLNWALPARDLVDQVSLPELLIGLQFLATDEDRKNSVATRRWDEATPASMQVIKSGVTSITRTWTKATAAAGGAAGLLTTAAGVVAAFGQNLRAGLGDPIVVALVGSGALILSATALALAVFVKGDLEARGRATAARHAGRAEVAAMFLHATSEMTSAARATSQDALRQEILAAFAAFPGNVSVLCKGSPGWMSATAICRGEEGFQIRVDGKDWKPIEQVLHYTTDPT